MVYFTKEVGINGKFSGSSSKLGPASLSKYATGNCWRCDPVLVSAVAADGLGHQTIYIHATDSISSQFPKKLAFILNTALVKSKFEQKVTQSCKG